MQQSPAAVDRCLIHGFSAATKAPFSFATTSGGVPFGATMPNQPADSNPGKPDSAKVGKFGTQEKRSR